MGKGFQTLFLKANDLKKKFEKNKKFVFDFE
jgi:hypothetical protein